MKKTSDRFWAKVKKSPGCWLWTGYFHDYGMFRFRGRSLIASRMAWILTHGPIKSRLCVCHKCNNKRCVRPSHLFLGTYSDNMAHASATGALANSVSPRQIRKVKIELAKGKTEKEIAQKCGVSEGTVSKFRRGKMNTRFL